METLWANIYKAISYDSIKEYDTTATYDGVQAYSNNTKPTATYINNNKPTTNYSNVDKPTANWTNII